MCAHWSDSNYSRSEGTSHGETECYGRSYSTGISRSESISVGPSAESMSFWTPSKNTSASARVSAAAVPLERQLQSLARHLTLAEFHALRVRIDDYFDQTLLNGV